MFNNFNVGIIGAGGIAGVMAETLKKMSGVKCYAISSRSLEKAQEFGEKYNVKKCYGSYEEMLMDKKVDLVYIATPHSEHYEHTKLCIQYKKPILCEKAFMANAEQAKEICAMAEQEQVFLTEAIWTRYMPMLAIIKEVLASDVIGDVKMVTGNLAYKIDHVERMVNPTLAGGALLDLGVYIINWASMILGADIEKVESSMQKTDTGVDRQESITIQYENGAMAVLNCSMSGWSDRMGCIYGTKGYAIVENINNFESMRVYNDKHEEIADYKRPKQISGYEYEVEACIRALNEGWLQCPEMPHNESIRIMEVMDGLRNTWGIHFPFEKEQVEETETPSMEVEEMK